MSDSASLAIISIVTDRVMCLKLFHELTKRFWVRHVQSISETFAVFNQPAAVYGKLKTVNQDR